MKTLIKNAVIITMDEDKVLYDASLVVSEDKIVYVGENPPHHDFDKVIDAKGGIVMPGLVNTHTHIPMTLFRGYADDLPLQTWLFDHIFPAEGKLTADAVYWSSLLACAEMIKSGTTTFADMYFFSDMVVRAAIESKMNANVSRCVSGQGEEYKKGLIEAKALFSEYHNAEGGSILIDYALHAIYTCGKKAIYSVANTAKTENANIHIHLSETMKENRDCYQQFGKSPTEIFSDLGVFECRTNAAHCVYLSGNDMDILEEHGVGVTHNPVSNLKLASGVANIKEMFEKGLLVSIGTDGAASNNALNLFSDMKLTALLHKGMRLDSTLISAQTALNMATVNGAKVLGRENTGKLKEGYQADIIILDADSPNLMPMYHPISTAVYSTSGGEVVSSMINGKLVMENRELLTIDMDKVKYHVNAYAEKMKN